MAAYDFFKLDNGVRIVFVPIAGVQSVGVGVYIGTGSRHESPKINGISHFLEHMAFKGTKKFPSHKETSYLEGLGAIQNAWTDVDATCYWCKIPADKWAQGLELVKELAMFPTIPANDLEIERGVILEEINRREDRPDEMVEEELQKIMFAGNNLAMTVLGETEVIKNVSREDFLDYHKRRYVSTNLVVVIAGKLDEASKLKTAVEAWFGGLEKQQTGETSAFVDSQKAPNASWLAKETAAQAHLELGVRGVNSSDPDRFAVSVLTAYLGQGLSSRLFIEVREKRGLCYAIRAYSNTLADTGAWSVYAGLNVDKLEEAMKAIVAELVRVKQEKLDSKELSEAKEKIRGPLLFSMENPVHQMEFYGRQALERPEEILDYNQVVERIMAVDAEDIQKVAQRLFVTRSVNLAVIGPVKKEQTEKVMSLLNLG